MKVAVIYLARQSFTRTDVEILRSKYEVREVRVDRESGLRLLSTLVVSARAAITSDIVFAWFGSFHALLPFMLGRLFGRLCVVVAGGYDVDAVPDIRYGNMLAGWRRPVGLAVFRLAHAIVPFSKSAERAALANARANPAKVRMIYLGIETPAPPAAGALLKSGAITVARVDRSNLIRKGLLTFVQAARFAPAIPFTVIGHCEDDTIEVLRRAATANVNFTGAVTDDELVQRMWKAHVYVQASAHEGFGRAVAEAMLCECIPVVTDRGSLPEIVGDAGFYVPVEDPEALARTIQRAVQSGPEAATRARVRITRLFGVERRREALLQMLDDLIRERRVGSPTSARLTDA